MPIGCSPRLLAEHAIEVINLAGTYIKGAGRHQPLFFDGHRGSPEDLAAAHFEAQGYEVLHTESRPFHALYGIMMWIWVQDYADPKNRVVGFGREYLGEDLGLVLCVLPPDFGLPAHAERRAASLEEHFQSLPSELSEMLWLFDYWHDHARELCLYLYGYEPDIVATARKVIQVLGAQTICCILRYLAAAYWDRYLGWPDLLVFKDGEYFFVEVKASGDNLSDDQKLWIREVHAGLALPFKLVKIHRSKVVDST